MKRFDKKLQQILSLKKKKPKPFKHSLISLVTRGSDMHRVSVLVPLSTGCYTVWDAALVCVSVSVCVCWQIRESATENSCRCSAAARFFGVRRVNGFEFFFYFVCFHGNEARFWLAVVAGTLKNRSGLGGNSHKGWTPVENVCFPHQSTLSSVLFNFFTFGLDWRGTVYWFIVSTSWECR